MLAGQHFPLSQLKLCVRSLSGTASPCSVPGFGEDPASLEPRHPISAPPSHKGRSLPCLPLPVEFGRAPHSPRMLARRLTQVVEAVRVRAGLLCFPDKLEIMGSFVHYHARVLPAAVNNVTQPIPRMLLHLELGRHILHLNHFGAVRERVHCSHPRFPFRTGQKTEGGGRELSLKIKQVLLKLQILGFSALKDYILNILKGKVHLPSHMESCK